MRLKGLGRGATVVVIAGLGVLLGTGTLFDQFETVEGIYATYAEAERAGAVERGWIPAFVPRSATEIEEVHDLDTNWQRLRYRAPVEDLQAMVESMRRLTREEAERMGGDVSGGALQIYRDTTMEAGAACVAVDFRQAVASAWTCRGFSDGDMTYQGTLEPS